MDFARYLEAKKTVDDRSLDRRVLERLRIEAMATPQASLVDIGAGSGIGTERLLSWGVVDRPRATLVDRDANLIALANERLAHAGTIDCVAATLAEFSSAPENLERFDIVVAHAVLDDVDLPEGLQDAIRLARPDGLLYLPVTFDGHTIFEPEDDEDDPVLGAYHRSMERTGHPRTGRRLFAHLRAERVEVLEAGSSDWIVYGSGGAYPHQEQFFLECILELIVSTVGTSANGWAERRKRQVDSGTLVYIAHQLDLLVRKRLPTA